MTEALVQAAWHPLRVDVRVRVQITPQQAIPVAALETTVRDIVKTVVADSRLGPGTYKTSCPAGHVDLTVLDVDLPPEPDVSVTELVAAWRTKRYDYVVSRLQLMHPCATAHFMCEIMTRIHNDLMPFVATPTGRIQQLAKVLHELTNRLTDAKTADNREKFGLHD